MTRRKIQLVGGGTYSVSLPKEWAETRGIEPGDEVGLHTHLDGVLVIEPQDGDGLDGVPEQVVLDADDLDAARVQRLLIAAYAAGIDRITVRFDAGVSSAQRHAVGSAAAELTGMTVVDESDTAITATVPVDPAEVSIRQSVRHFLFVATSMHRDGTAAVFGETSPESVLERTEQANRLHALVDRHFRRSLSKLDEVDALGITREELFRLWTASRELKRVAESAETLAETARDLDSPPERPLTADLRDAAQTARNCVETATPAVVDGGKVDPVRESIEAGERVRGLVDDLDARLFDEDAGDPRLTRATKAIERTADSGTAIAEIGLRQVISRQDCAGGDADAIGGIRVAESTD
ncbi:AbrB/MazE/SpoVT family DNA-binding domain-containing protein [Halobaculum sp. WSA2]|uniref:AbrB/MazE/SpoVT family DNA-binding domain-containing protein n=1 Tax=Halobaculum saliterrae TaxID=2073113 RepID=A0A6B0SVX7_9EURY|nr:phosphate uptake regulator PhoU [Halobaculum saliterrae]MXR40392.1 AbrB/MazE/SpoVT family DNA-binding domain-containing protein [Halobaculum saliterrae]